MGGLIKSLHYTSSLFVSGCRTYHGSLDRCRSDLQLCGGVPVPMILRGVF